VVQGYSRGTLGVVHGYSRGTLGGSLGVSRLNITRFCRCTIGTPIGLSTRTQRVLTGAQLTRDSRDVSGTQFRVSARAQAIAHTQAHAHFGPQRIYAVRAPTRHGRGPAVFIAQPRQSDGYVCVLRWSSVGSRALAAGVSWASRTTSAPWAGRTGHTSVVDAAGAIYVIGGITSMGSGSRYRDVWATTDGGADGTRAGGGRGGTGWAPRGTTRVL
jgi:hypothetical protein